MTRITHGIALATALLLPLAASGQEGQVARQGVYQYQPWITEAHGGEEQQLLSASQEAGPISFDRGALTDAGTATVGWRGRASAPKTVAVVFDLLADQTVRRVELLATAPNRYWRIREVELDYRAADSEVYRVGGHRVWEDGQPIIYDLSGVTARYVRIRLSRVHEFVHIPLDQVRIMVDDAPGSVASPPATLDAEFDRDTMLVDQYGQYVYETWPGKIRSDEDLHRDADEEARWLATHAPDRSHLDTYGGNRTYPREEATGFFRLAKLDDRWWFITPEGHRFFVIGVDGVSWREWGYATPLQKPDGTPRRVFESLPDRQRFDSAYRDDSDRASSVSFVVANLMRKYGDDFAQRWAEMTTQRLHTWGFNTHAKWTRDPAVTLPYITVLRPRGERRIKWALDPFDPNFDATLEAGMRDRLSEMRDDPWIIGHTFENERGWDRSIVESALAMTQDTHAKRAFLTFLQDDAGLTLAQLVAALGVDADSIDALLSQPLTAPSTLDPQIDRFIALASARYHEAVRRVIRQHDPNHVFLGCSLVPGWKCAPAWIAASVPYVDALSFDIYNGDPSWITAYEPYDRPILLLEFSFSVHGRGLRAHSAASAAPDERSRGLRYRHLVEHLAASPQFVGFGWFLHYDQPVTRRNIPGGESFNMGLINQADQPYWQMIDEMAQTNARLYDVHAGQTPPFTVPGADGQ